MSSDFTSAVSRITEVVMFENWLRFYFIVEEGEELVIRVPEKAMGQLQTRYPALVGLAERLNNKEIDHQSSLNAVCLFVASAIDGQVLPEEVISRVFDSADFHLEIQLFGQWVQGHEEQLDAGFMEFADWQDHYANWKQTEEVQSYKKRLKESMAFAHPHPSDTTQ